MDTQEIHLLVKSTFFFTDKEYEQWRKVFKMEQDVNKFVDYVHNYMLVPHNNAARDFLNRYMGKYTESAVAVGDGQAVIKLYNITDIPGPCGVGTILTRESWEVLQLVSNNGMIEALSKQRVKMS